jgi:DNA-binding response OmpR family regulator
MMMSKRILVVEDEPLMLKFLEFRLLKDGYEVHVAKDGKEAERRINEESFDLIITDLLLPFVSGFELLEITKQTEHNKNTAVLILSSLHDENAVIRTLQLGADDFLSKPVAMNVLSTKVKLLMNKLPIAA